MGRITIFTEDSCQQSLSLRDYLAKNNVPFHDISLTTNPDRRRDMITLSNNLSTPQVFFNCLHIGGFKEVQDYFDVYVTEGIPSSYSHDVDLSSTSSSFSTEEEEEEEEEEESAYSKIILERLTKSVLEQSPPNHESKLRLPSQKTQTYHKELQFEYDSWVKRLKANECFTFRHASGEVQLSICEVTMNLMMKLPQQNHYEYPLVFHKIHTKCFKGKHLIPILKREYSFLNSNDDVLAFAQTLLDFGILHHVIHSKKKMNTSSRNNECEGTFQEATADRITFDLDGIFRVQALHATQILNKFRLWTKLCIVDGHDPKPLMTLSRLSNQLNSAIEKGINYDKSMISHESIRSSSDFHHFEQMTCLLQLTNLDNMHEKERFAFFINLYNLMFKHAIILQQHSPKKSIFYSKTQWMVGEYVFSLDDIYHGILRCNSKHPKTNKAMFSESDERNKFKCSSLNPRVHFVLNSNYFDSKGDNIHMLINSYEYHREAVNGELFLVAHQRCKADERIVVDDYKDILSLPSFIKVYLHDFINHSNGIDSEFLLEIKKFLIGEKREILEQMMRKANSPESKKRITINFLDNHSTMSIQRGLGCVPFMCTSAVKASNLGAFPQNCPEDELLLLDEDYSYSDPEMTSIDFDDNFSKSSSYVRDVYMSNAWDSFSYGASSWSLSLRSIETTLEKCNNESKAQSHRGLRQNLDRITEKFPSTPNNKYEGHSHSPSNTIKTASTTLGSPLSSDPTTSHEFSHELAFPDFLGDDLSFDETTNYEDGDGEQSEDSSCSTYSGPPKAKRVVENGNYFVKDIKEGDNVKTTKEIINLFFPQSLVVKKNKSTDDDDGDISYSSADDGLSYQSHRLLKHGSFGSVVSRDTQFENLFNASIGSI